MSWDGLGLAMMGWDWLRPWIGWDWLGLAGIGWNWLGLVCEWLGCWGWLLESAGIGLGLVGMSSDWFGLLGNG